MHASRLFSENESSKNLARTFCDELGDVLLQVVLNAQLADEKGHFKLADVVKIIDDKMIRRHPHVFAPETAQAETSQDVLRQWAEIKADERAAAGSEPTTRLPSLLDTATKKSDLPTLMYGEEVSARTRKLGFYWPDIPSIFAQLESEVLEFKEEITAPTIDFARIADEAGDIIYSLCCIFIFLRKTYPDAASLSLDLAARGAIDKLVNRFYEMERMAHEKNQPLTEESAKALSLDAWDNLWREAKRRRAD